MSSKRLVISFKEGEREREREREREEEQLECYLVNI
jgi:hypothetical protein